MAQRGHFNPGAAKLSSVHGCIGNLLVAQRSPPICMKWEILQSPSSCLLAQVRMENCWLQTGTPGVCTSVLEKVGCKLLCRTPWVAFGRLCFNVVGSCCSCWFHCQLSASLRFEGGDFFPVHMAILAFFGEMQDIFRGLIYVGL